MKKRSKRIVLNYFLDWTYGIEISKLRFDLDEVEKLGATHIDIESWEGGGVEITARYDRLETDDEISKRVTKEREKADNLRARELREFKRLKEKYGE